MRTQNALGEAALQAHDEAGNVLCQQRPLNVAARSDVSKGFAARLSVAALVALVCGTGTPAAAAQLTQHRYDELGKLVETTDVVETPPSGALSGLQLVQYTFAYDPQRNLVAKQDARGSLTTYEQSPAQPAGGRAPVAR